jgi:hypothetical protein
MLAKLLVALLVQFSSVAIGTYIGVRLALRKGAE